MAAGLKGWDSNRVIGAFKELRIEVSDDKSEISKSYNKRTSHYTDLRESPDQDDQRQGELHIENGTALQSDKQRAKLLDVVYQTFSELGDATVSALQSKSVNSAFRDALIKIGKSQCHYRDDLCDQAFLRFLQERGLEVGGQVDIYSAEAVQNFRAESIGQGSIRLCWDNPDQNFDKVVIRRPGTNTPIYTGKGSEYVVNSLTTGEHQFEAVSFFLGEEDSGTLVSAIGLSMGEIEDTKVVFSEDRVKLSWELPFGSDRAAVFRKKDGKPEVKPGDPTPANSETKKVYHGSDCFTEDSGALEEGATYHYLFAAIYGSDKFTLGKETTVPIPRRPDGVSSLNASANSLGEVILSWTPVNCGPGLNYCLYRREGGIAPGMEDESERIAVCENSRYVDVQVLPGKQYTYSIFTAQGGLWGKTSAESDPVVIMEEVTGVTVQEGDGVVSLQWDEPGSGAPIEIRRSLSKDISDSATPIALSGPTSAVDTSVKNGRKYHYKISVVYNAPSGGKVRSKGVDVDAVPLPLPEAVTEFKVEAEGSEAICQWTADSSCTYRIFRSSAELIAPKVRMSTIELEGLIDAESATEVVITGASGKVIDPSPSSKTPFYSIFTVSGANAISGGTFNCAVCPDISGLIHKVTREGVELRWRWPSSCNSVKVARKLGSLPQSINDVEAVTVTIPRMAYENSGMKYLDRMTGSKEGDHFFYRVFAQSKSNADSYLSSATTAETQVSAIWRKPMSLRYNVEKNGGNGSLTFRCKVEDPLSDFGGFVVLAKQEQIPQHINDGVELLNCEAGEEKRYCDGKKISLKKIPSHWHSFYLKLILKNQQQSQRALVIHPNISHEFSLSGDRVERGQSKYGIKWKPSVPKTLICPSPSCNEEISAGEILFGDFGYDTKDTQLWRRGKKTIRGGVKPPLDSHKRVMIRKICPECRVDLPFSAGTMDSKSIAVIGSKGSGKSTYLISLINQLKKHVAPEFNASLHAQSQATADGFEAERRSLFQNKERLSFSIAATSFTYDIVFDGSCWGDNKIRAVTMPFYDTPGDNFSRHEEMSKYTQYLRSVDGIILNIDPLQDPQIYDLLPDFPTVGEQQSPSTIINNFTQFLGKASINVPVAIVFTKADTLIGENGEGLIDPYRLWSSDRRHRREYDLELHNDCAGMWMEFAEKYFPESVSQFKTKFSRFAFFGASATGTHEDSSGRFPFVAPMRVEDPMLWMFYNLGIIPGNNRKFY